MSNYMKQKQDVFLKYGTGANDLASAIIHLTEELNEARKDSARLDWLFLNLSEKLYWEDSDDNEWSVYCRDSIDEASSSDDEPTECEACDGIGEFQGDPNTNQFPKCARCDGSGVKE